MVAENIIIFLGTCMAVLTRNGYVAILTLCIFLILQIYQAHYELEAKQNMAIRAFHQLENVCDSDLEFLSTSPDFIVFFADIISWRSFNTKRFDQLVGLANTLFLPNVTRSKLETINNLILQHMTHFSEHKPLQSHIAIAQERFKRMYKKHFKINFH